MTGARGQRAYLDWNATAPLRPEARAAMLQAMDAVGNPSSVHAEGRAARATVEKARRQVAALVGCEPSEIVFTSGATEANRQALGMAGTVFHSAAEHDSVTAAADFGAIVDEVIGIDGRGAVEGTHRCFRTSAENPAETSDRHRADIVLAIGGACSENGVVQDLVSLFARVEDFRQRAHTDVTQLVGRLPFCFAYSMAKTAALSAHKLGGPKGVGALLVRDGLHPTPLIPGGGQESGRRAGTENVVGIAGFGAAAEAALRDLQAGVWGRVARLRDQLEGRLESAAPDLIIVGRGAPRLPNTSCFAMPGWAGETQVMLMDLAGFAVSAGSACSSGKVDRASRVLLAMGFDSVTASSALRVSLGPTTTEAEVMAFADAWIDCCRRRNSRAA